MNLWALHGSLATLALLCILPLGIISRWMKGHRLSPPHWAVQTAGVLVLGAAGVIGWTQSRAISHKHQHVGSIVLSLVIIQSFVGLVSRSINSDDRVQHFTASAHVVTGFSILFLGWLAILTGIQLAGFSSTAIMLLGLLSATEVSFLVTTAFLLRCSAWNSQRRKREEMAGPVYTLAVGDDSSEDLGLYDEEAKYDSPRSMSTTRSDGIKE